MATLTPSPPASAGMGSEPPFAVVRVGEGERLAAVARLLGLDVRDEGAVRGFVRQAEADGTDLTRLWAAVRGHRAGQAVDPSAITQVCMGVVNAGRTAVMLVSSGGGRGGDEERAWACSERAAAIDEAFVTLARPEEQGGAGIVLAQGLTEPDEAEQIASFQAGGFWRLADLHYMRRPVPRAAAGAPALGAGFERVALDEAGPAGEGLLRAALEASYEGTLDCPDLCGLRTLDDVVASHRAVGRYDPSLWWVVMGEGRPAGCLLLSRGAGPDTAELVYLGVAAWARGKGLGETLLRQGLAELGRRGDVSVACAVDVRNAPALALYRKAGFRRFATRAALVRATSGGPRERAGG